MEKLISHKKKGIEESFICEKSDLLNAEEKYGHFHLSIQETSKSGRKATLIFPQERIAEIYPKLGHLIKRIQARVRK